MGSEKLATYKTMTKEMFDQVEKSLGSHVVILILEHAQWKTKEKYEEANLIQFSESGISLDGLDDIDPNQAEKIAHEFTMTIITSLGRLVGKELASKLTKYLEY
ncbi:MAG: hypothetical protein APF84_02225 [Gracilibacter sp. BRH_c7a]|nr:MAG: hypothetical protein APF84_02225 [Gracilibacter sp. BRH_c7a]